MKKGNSHRKFTAEEKRWILENYRKFTYKEMGEHFGCSWWVVRNQTIKLRMAGSKLPKKSRGPKIGTKYGPRMKPSAEPKKPVSAKTPEAELKDFMTEMKNSIEKIQVQTGIGELPRTWSTFTISDDKLKTCESVKNTIEIMGAGVNAEIQRIHKWYAKCIVVALVFGSLLGAALALALRALLN